MSGSDSTVRDAGIESATEPTVAEAIHSVKYYDVTEGVVFYDINNPLEWLQADNAIRLEDAA